LHRTIDIEKVKERTQFHFSFFELGLFIYPWYFPAATGPGYLIRINDRKNILAITGVKTVIRIQHAENRLS
jgi:hypothetical protein